MQSPDSVRVFLALAEQELYQALHHLLSHRGYTCIGAHNGAASLEAIKNDPHVDLLIVDRSLECLSGIELLTALRELSILPEFLFLSSVDSTANSLQALQLKPLAQIRLPASPLEMIDQVEKLYSTRRQDQTGSLA